MAETLIFPGIYHFLPRKQNEAGASGTSTFPSRTDWVKWTILRYFLYFFPTLRVKMPYNMGKTGYIQGFFPTFEYKKVHLAQSAELGNESASCLPFGACIILLSLQGASPPPLYPAGLSGLTLNFLYIKRKS
ncbi:MAG: hypothetical protein HZB37_00435 [Planctomycetes bacterium]|nr:hypothetical protein [Planctomycetota bacterium]